MADGSREREESRVPARSSLLPVVVWIFDPPPRVGGDRAETCPVKQKRAADVRRHCPSNPWPVVGRARCKG